MITPIDGFSVQRVDDVVIMVLSNRYGEAEEFRFNPEDARKIGEGLLMYSLGDE
jgi:hypothetical protein